MRHQLERSAVRVVRPYRRLHRRVAYRELLGLHAHLASVHQGYVGVRIVLPRLPVVPDADVGLPRAGSPLLRRVPPQVVLAVLGSPDRHRHPLGPQYPQVPRAVVVRPLRSRLIAYLYARARCRNLVVSRVRIILHAIPAGHIHVRAVGPHAVLVIAYAHHRTVTPVRLPVRVIPVDRPVLVACRPYREPHTLHARWRSDVVRHQLERSAVRVVRSYRRLHRRVAYYT